MTTRKKLKNDEASRLMRRSAAYMRLAHKSMRNGDGGFDRYFDTANKLRDRALRIRARAAERASR